MATVVSRECHAVACEVGMVGGWRGVMEATCERVGYSRQPVGQPAGVVRRWGDEVGAVAVVVGVRREIGMWNAEGVGRMGWEGEWKSLGG